MLDDKMTNEQELDMLVDINKILKSEYNHHTDLKSMGDVRYQCFVKSTAVFSGKAIVEVYEYLKSKGIGI